MGDTYRQSLANNHAKRVDSFVEFLRTCNNGQNNLMYYVDFYSLFNHTEKDWESILEATSEVPREPSLFD